MSNRIFRPPCSTPYSYLRGLLLELGLADVLQLVRLPEHFGGAPEEGGERGLEDLDEGLDLLGEAHQKILGRQVVLGLLQGPPVSGLPALIRGNSLHLICHH